MWTMILADVVSDVVWILFLLWALRSNSTLAKRLRFVVETRIMKKHIGGYSTAEGICDAGDDGGTEYDETDEEEE